MRITIVTGAEGAPFAHEVAALLDPSDELTVVAPTVRGHFSARLEASPDIDALLTGGTTPTYAVHEALEAVGYTPRWQRASDQAVAIRLVRTDLAATGVALTEATIASGIRAALPYRLLPMCDDRAEFRVVVGADSQARAIHIDEYLDDPATHDATQLLLIADQISISPALSQTLVDTDVLVLGPSSRTLAIDPVLRTPRFLELVGDDLPVLVVEHTESAPADLVRVAGLQQPDPGRAESVPADPAAVVDRIRQLA